MKDKRFWIFILGYSIFMIFGVYSFAYSHELAHQEIFKEWGINSTIKIDKFGAWTIPDDWSKCNDTCILAHNINESISYSIITFYVLFSFSISLLFIILWIYSFFTRYYFLIKDNNTVEDDDEQMQIKKDL